MELLSPRYLDTRRTVIGFNPPNDWDCCLEDEARMMQEIESLGGLCVVCKSPDWGDAGAKEPWKTQPRGSRPVSKTGSQTIAALAAVLGTDVEVISYVCPEGWDGNIQITTNLYTGGGFEEGGGQLVWRIRYNAGIGAYYANNYGSILTTQGSLQAQGLPDWGAGLLIRSNQRISYDCRCTDAALLDPAARVICTLKGYIWPRKGASNL